MKLTIHYSRTQYVEIDMLETAKISELLTTFYVALEQHDPEKFSQLTQGSILLFSGTWLELDKTISEYGISSDDHIHVTSLYYTEEEPGPNPQDIPSEFVCTLTGSVFLEPMLLPTGETAEKEYLHAWVKSKAICPFNRQPIELETLKPNVELLKKLSRFTQAYSMFASVVSKLQYQPQDIQLEPHSTRGPANPTADDLLAMGVRPQPGNPFAVISLPLLADLMTNAPILTDLNVAFARYHAESIGYCVTVYTHLMVFYATVLGLRAFARGFSQPNNATISPFPSSGTSLPPRRRATVFQPSYMERTIIDLQAAQVTEELMREHWQPHATDSNSSWGMWHRAALLRVISYNFNSSLLIIIQALQEITQLNTHQLQVLWKFYNKGLRGSHLRAWQDHNQSNHFTSEHLCVLETLVRDCSMSVEDALNKIQGVSGEGALQVMDQERSARGYYTNS